MARHRSTADPGSDIDEIDRQIEQEAVGDLELFDSSEFNDYEWVINRMRSREEIAADPTGPVMEFWTKKVGPLDYAQLREELGGGAFELRGSVRVDGRKILQRKPVRRFAGPRLKYPGAPLVTANGVGAPAPPANDAIARILERMDQRLSLLESGGGKSNLSELVHSLAALDALRDRNQPAPPPPAPGIGELVTALKGIHEMSGSSAPREPNSVEFAKEMVGMLHQGITIGQAREPIAVSGDGDGPNYMPVVEKVIDIFSAMMARRQSPPRQPAGTPPQPAGRVHVEPTPVPVTQPGPPSSATVVDDEPEAPPVTDLSRWNVATEATYRAMLSGDDPGDFAGSLEHILNDAELSLIRDGNPPPSAKQVLVFLGPLSTQFPQLMTTQGEVYLDAVLAALRNPQGEDDQE